MAERAHGDAPGGRLLGLLMALALLAALLVGLPSGASAAVVERISGPDRFSTAVAVSRDAFPVPADVSTVHVATGADFADALAAGAAAAEAGGPVLLAMRDLLPDVTRDELRRLQPDQVVIVGGPAAIGPDVEAAIRDDAAIGATVMRVSGRDRFETAAALAQRAFPDGAQHVHIATGLGFADALAGVPAAGAAGGPLLLVAPHALPQATRDALAALEPEHAVVLGGPGAVSDAVLAELRTMVSEVARAHGRDRFTTSVAVSASTFPSADTAYVATGLDFPDALAGGPAAALASGPLLLVHDGGVPDQVAAELRRLGVDRIVVLGGRAAVPDAVAEQLRAATSPSRTLRPDEVPDIAYDTVTASDQRQRIAVARIDGASAHVTSPPSGTADRLATFSPDGGLLAFVRAPEGSARRDDVHVVAASARDDVGQRLTDLGADPRFDGCNIAALDWAPDGQAIAFDCLRDASTPARAGVVTLDGDVTLVGGGPASRNDLSPAFSPDGTQLAFVRVGGGDPGDLSTLRLVPRDQLSGPSAQVRGSERYMFDVTWSPDGASVAVIEATGTSRSDGRVVITDVGTGAAQVHLGEPAGAEAAGPHHLEQWLGDELLVRTEAAEERGPRVAVLRSAGAQAGTAEVLVTGAELTGDAIERASLSPGGILVHDDLERSGSQFVRGALRLLQRSDGHRSTVDVGSGNHAGPTWNPAASR